VFITPGNALWLNLIEITPSQAIAELIHILKLEDGALTHADLTASFVCNPQYDEGKCKAKSGRTSNRAAEIT
jgi:hypothetical protein